MVTKTIIAVTCIVSYLCFQDRKLFGKLSFNAFDVVHRKQYYRLVTNGFVHADWGHLLMNMMVLYFFGETLEAIFTYWSGGNRILYPLLYLTAVPAASLASLLNHKDDPYYTAVGASGAVNAVIFSYILINPLSSIYLFFAIPIKAVLFAILYLVYSSYMARKNSDNIGHEAHVSGAMFGLVFTIATLPGVVRHFVGQLFSWV